MILITNLEYVGVLAKRKDLKDVNLINTRDIIKENLIIKKFRTPFQFIGWLNSEIAKGHNMSNYYFRNSDDKEFKKLLTQEYGVKIADYLFDLKIGYQALINSEIKEEDKYFFEVLNALMQDNIYRNMLMGYIYQNNNTITNSIIKYLENEVLLSAKWSESQYCSNDDILDGDILDEEEEIFE